MQSKQIAINTIGIIHAPFNKINDMPTQLLASKGIKGYIELFSAYTKGLIDLASLSHIALLYHLHKINGYYLITKPFIDNNKHGIFASKSPKQPNAIGLSTVKLLGVENNIVHIEMVDILNGSKSFFSKFGNRTNTKSRWLDD